MSESWASNPSVRAIMRANRHRDTRPELALRSAIHGMGLRFRVNARPLKSVRRTVDIVFPKVKVAVFVDGCFWHGCDEHYRPATGANSDFWHAKIAGNKSRDADTDRKLREEGWTVIRVWEHEAPEDAALRVSDTVRTRRANLADSRSKK